MKVEVFRQIFPKNNQIPNFIKIRPLGAEVFYAKWLTRQDKTDGRDEANNAFFSLQILLTRLKIWIHTADRIFIRSNSGGITSAVCRPILIRLGIKNNLYEEHLKYQLVNPLNPELNPICYLLALLAHHFLHVSRISVKSLTLRLLMSYIYGAPILDVSRSHTTTHHSR